MRGSNGSLDIATISSAFLGPPSEVDGGLGGEGGTISLVSTAGGGVFSSVLLDPVILLNASPSLSSSPLDEATPLSLISVNTLYILACHDTREEVIDSSVLADVRGFLLIVGGATLSPIETALPPLVNRLGIPDAMNTSSSVKFSPLDLLWYSACFDCITLSFTLDNMP